MTFVIVFIKTDIKPSSIIGGFETEEGAVSFLEVRGYAKAYHHDTGHCYEKPMESGIGPWGFVSFPYAFIRPMQSLQEADEEKRRDKQVIEEEKKRRTEEYWSRRCPG